MEELKIEFASDLVSSYKRLSYKIWYALAEYVDNSTQAYENNKAILDKVYETEKSNLIVNINYFRGQTIEEDYFEIIDNSIGMSTDDLKRAFKIGLPPENNTGRSKYGLGMKTASFWLGDEWTIHTKKLNENTKSSLTLNLKSIAQGSLSLNIETEEADTKDHYTVIKIYGLHRRFKGMTISKIKSFLSSIYRFDLINDRMDLVWNGEKLEWSNFVDNDFIKNSEMEPLKRPFDFMVNNKRVHGWAGILSSGSRNKGGFSLIKHERVIQSPPNGYKPESIFGEQEGGINDLVNQRLVGEIYLDDFEVSHTKDSILWEGTEEEDLDDQIFKEIGDFKKTAVQFRKRAVDERGPSEEEVNIAIDEITKELNSGEIADTLFALELPSDDIISISNTQLEEVSKSNIEPIIVTLNQLTIKLYVDDTMSINDPYVINNSTSDRDTVIIIVNKNHPFWNELGDSRGVLNYLRQCVYDGVSEWKAYFFNSSIKPNTIKYIKDDLLRVPFNIERS
ncbi:ATP-binding protein [Flavobacterium sp. 5]|uniref:ATP-binding protein n=1 Tax=Flavobacterium sp. 5 TaxID=2035199 RepID=UPI000C2C367B|nr:ATP-binding protein [Flavobacterium sp. 5]PKB18047.1 histidine kinase/DNA gyrase B/HSP90-like ATPase [Flavobacterium sp. 5]